LRFNWVKKDILDNTVSVMIVSPNESILSLVRGLSALSVIILFEVMFSAVRSVNLWRPVSVMRELYEMSKDPSVFDRDNKPVSVIRLLRLSERWASLVNFRKTASVMKSFDPISSDSRLVNTSIRVFVK
jgi:hypothetical protein